MQSIRLQIRIKNKEEHFINEIFYGMFFFCCYGNCIMINKQTEICIRNNGFVYCIQKIKRENYRNKTKITEQNASKIVQMCSFYKKKIRKKKKL